MVMDLSNLELWHFFEKLSQLLKFNECNLKKPYIPLCKKLLLSDIYLPPISFDILACLSCYIGLTIIFCDVVLIFESINLSINILDIN
jgi:hypothetical protein